MPSSPDKTTAASTLSTVATGPTDKCTVAVTILRPAENTSDWSFSKRMCKTLKLEILAELPGYSATNWEAHFKSTMTAFRFMADPM